MSANLPGRRPFNAGSSSFIRSFSALLLLVNRHPPSGNSFVTTTEIEGLVLGAVRALNLARPADMQLQVTPDAPLFGSDSPLDSLGLVSLLIDIEEALSDRGFDVTLGDAKAMSRSASPFRNVPVLVEYIHNSLSTT
jgi:acyl carrier protein